MVSWVVKKTPSVLIIEGIQLNLLSILSKINLLFFEENMVYKSNSKVLSNENEGQQLLIDGVFPLQAGSPKTRRTIPAVPGPSGHTSQTGWCRPWASRCSNHCVRTLHWTGSPKLSVRKFLRQIIVTYRLSKNTNLFRSLSYGRLAISISPVPMIISWSEMILKPI